MNENNPKPSKRSIGNKAEDKAVRFLEEKGYEILERNFYSRYGEIDIIARDQDMIVFVEVKYRAGNSFGSPLESISAKKIRSICKTSRYYLKSEDISARFDVISIIKDKIEHLENAFDYIF
jgi:putative endonuclease